MRSNKVNVGKLSQSDKILSKTGMDEEELVKNFSEPSRVFTPNGFTDTEINAAIELASIQGGEVLLDSSKEYTLSNPLMVKSGVRINGNGAKIIPSVSGFDMFYFGTKKSTTSGLDIVVTTDTTSIPEINNLSVSVGDLIQLTNTKTERISGYYHGLLAQISYIDEEGTIYLSHKPHFSTTYDYVEVLEPAINCEIFNLNLDASNITNAKIINGWGVDSEIHHNHIIGSDDGEGFYAITLTGINCVARNNRINSFLDTSGGGTNGRWGYGINFSGHGMIGYDNQIKNCKHCVTGGTNRNIMSELIVYRSNIIDQGVINESSVGSIPPVDIHANCVLTKIYDNEIKGVYGMAQIQSPSAYIYNNKYKQLVENAYPSILLLVVDDKNGIHFYNNKCIAMGSSGGSIIGKFSAYNDINLTNINIENNHIEGVGFRWEDHTGDIQNLHVVGNSITANATGLTFSSTGTLSGVVFKDNIKWEYGTDFFGYATLFNCNNTQDFILVEGNKFIKGVNGSGSYSITIASESDGNVKIINNIVDVIIGDLSEQYLHDWTENKITDQNNTSGHPWKGGVEWKDSYLVSSDKPSTGSWYSGMVVRNKNPSSGDYASWVCTSSGTPGVWKGFGLIE